MRHQAGLIESIYMAVASLLRGSLSCPGYPSLPIERKWHLPPHCYI